MTTISDLHGDAALVVAGPPQWFGELEHRETPGPEATLLMMDRRGEELLHHFSGFGRRARDNHDRRSGKGE